MKIAKSISLFLLNFILFVLPILLIILGKYEVINCTIFSLKFCDFIFKAYKNNIYLILVIGFLISIFSFFSTFFEKKISLYFSIIYSFLILLFLMLTLNFGKVNLYIENLYGLDYMNLVLDFKFIFSLMIIGVAIDIIRKILNIF